MTEILFGGKQRDEIINKIKQISLSDSSTMRRTKLLAEDLLMHLDEGLKNAPCISSTIDESTDMTEMLTFYSSFDIIMEAKKNLRRIR